MNNTDRQYINLIKRIMEEGALHANDRTGVGTLRILGHQLRYNLQDSFPALTIKRSGFKNTLAELLFFISGSSSLYDLEKIYAPAVAYWKPWANTDNSVGKMYGRQLTNFNGQELNQLHNLVKDIINEPDSRRLLLTTYNPLETSEGVLTVCHGLHTQIQVNKGVLSLYTSQRSQDAGLGSPSNTMSYALLAHMLAHLTGNKVGELVYNLADSHIYLNHIEGTKEVIRRAEDGEADNLISPTLQINRKVDCIDDFTMDDFTLLNYNPLPSIELPIAV